MSGALLATQPQAVMPAATRLDASALATSMCQRADVHAYPWTNGLGGMTTTGFTANRSARRLRRCTT